MGRRMGEGKMQEGLCLKHKADSTHRHSKNQHKLCGCLERVGKEREHVREQ
jgi:hypothetical protein